MDVSEAIVAHIHAVRRNVTGLANATAVIIIERNLPLVASTLAHLFKQRRIPHTCIMHEANRKRGRATGGGYVDAVLHAGTLTSARNKPTMMIAIHEALRLGALKIHHEFTLGQPAKQDRDAPAPRQALLHELLNLKCEVVQPKDPRSGRAETLTFYGRDADGRIARTDYVMSLGFIMLHHPVHEASPDHAHCR